MALSMQCSTGTWSALHDVAGMLSRTFGLALVARAVHLAALVVLDQALPDYDTSAPLSQPERVDEGSGLVGLARSLVVWDSVFFDRIGTHGYEYEQYYAFFPLLPGVRGAWGGGMGRACSPAQPSASQPHPWRARSHPLCWRKTETPAGTAGERAGLREHGPPLPQVCGSLLRPPPLPHHALFG